MECFEGSFLAQQLNLINVFISSIIASTRVSFTVLVGQHGSQSIQDGLAGKILTCNQNKTAPLSGLFLFDQLEKFRVTLGKSFVEVSSSGKAASRKTTDGGGNTRSEASGEHHLSIL